MGPARDDDVAAANEALDAQDADETWADRAARHGHDRRPGWLRRVVEIPGLGLLAVRGGRARRDDELS